MKYIYKNIRISILENDIFRIEISKNKNFSDESSFYFQNLNKFNGYYFKDLSNEDEIILQIDDIFLKMRKNSLNFNSLRIEKNKRIIYKYKKLEHTGELPIPSKTPDIFPILDNPRIILPKHGYSIESFNNNEEFIIEDNIKDLYLIRCNKDYCLLRQKISKLTGNPELIRLQTLGLWNSRYYPYTQKEAENMILEYQKHNIILDNMVLDTEWRKRVSNDGTGYNVNTNLFPKIEDFFTFAHKHNVDIMMNDHPLPVEGCANLFSKEEVIYREKNLKEKLSLGLDYWRYDRNWTTRLKTPVKSISFETLGAYLFNDITRNYYSSLTSSKYYRRPIVMSNIDNVRNGDYERIKNIASHRYSFQWSGDINVHTQDLNKEVRNLVKCSNNGICFYSSDIGGHVGNPTKEEYIKYMQYGAFSPILRPHCTKEVTIFREPWCYDQETLDISRNYINMRLHLLNYLYTACFFAYKDLEPICKPLNFNYQDKVVDRIYNEYLFGNNILVAPLSEDFSKTINKNIYVDNVEANFYSGKEIGKNLLLSKELKEINFVLNNEKLYEEVPIYDFCATFKTKLKFKKDMVFSVKSDDGVRVYVDGKLKVDDWNYHGLTENDVMIVKKNQIYDLYIEYFQGGGEAGLQLCSRNIPSAKKKIYLPNDKWINAFNGKIYHGKKYIKNKFLLNELPLFIKDGSIIPLYKNIDQIKLMSTKHMVFDCYLSKSTFDHGYVYEDDYETVAYQYGKYRLTEYSSSFDEDSKTFIINLETIKNDLKDKMKFRYLTIKINHFNFKKIKSILVNGEEVNFKNHNRKKNMQPFNGSEFSNIFKTSTIKIKEYFNKKYKIEIKVF